MLAGELEMSRFIGKAMSNNKSDWRLHKCSSVAVGESDGAARQALCIPDATRTVSVQNVRWTGLGGQGGKSVSFDMPLLSAGV